MRLDFLVPGFSKCGTTTLCSLLADHPAIFMPRWPRKEPNFFAHKFCKGWDWYKSYFKNARLGQLCGEGSTHYSTAEFAPLACQRILSHFPDVRLIFIARNPIARLESSYRELHDDGHCLYGVHAPYSIGETLKQFPNMISSTCYWKLISVYRDHIPDERIDVLFLEDFERQPTEELAKCFRFLGVDASVQVDQPDRKLNSGSKKMYDSRLMRFVRAHAWTSRLWKRLLPTTRQRLERVLRLRKPFAKPIRWERSVHARVLDQIQDDTQQFLKFYGKAADFWDLSYPGAGAGRRLWSWGLLQQSVAPGPGAAGKEAA